jgi:GNAT superfamily N-acetyltransferase
LLRVENISKENLDDVFNICACAFEISSQNKFDCLLYKDGIEVRKRWLINMLDQQGPCVKIAYLDGKPVVQIQFCPEETIPYIRDPRKDVVDIICTYSPFPEAQRKGAATALVKDLVDECDSGLDCLGGKPCRFLVTLPFPRVGRLSLTEFYKKNGFRQGHKEMFLEIKGEYVPKEVPDYNPLLEDLDRTIILYNPACEWGYFYASKVEELIKGIDPDHPIDIYNIWENPEEYMKRSLQRVTAGQAIVKGQVTSGGIFWTDREAFHREVEEATRK